MRGQEDLAELAATVGNRLAPKTLAFYLGLGFLIIYSFVITQGVSPEETISGERIQTKVCETLTKIVSVTDTAMIYQFQQLCTNFVCRTRTMNASDMYESEISHINQIGDVCNTDEDEAFELFVEHCSNYCAKGFFDVKSVSAGIQKSMKGFVGAPDYCIFLKKGPMASVLVPRCTEGLEYNNQPVNLCMKGFTCYLSGPGAPPDQCGCDQLYDFKEASKEYLGDSFTFSNAEYDKYYTKFDNGDELRCGPEGQGELFFTADDPDELEWWFRHKAFPPETNDLGWNAFISNKFPKPICIITFGLLPFSVIFFLLKDSIMYFIPLKNELKQFAAIFISLLSLMFGTFDNVVLLISKLAGWTLSWSFLICIFGTAVFGAISNVVMIQMLQRKQANERVIRFASALGELSE